ncbi:MAG: glutamate racemase [Spirochaetaceae bacterium]|nr:glutamate racemase [Spirochaetaceae bacterium]
MTTNLTRHSIVFLDSGVGGLPYLAYARQSIPQIRLHYVADDKGFPYGNKTPERVRELLHDRVLRLCSRFLPDALVIACNTASQIGLYSLRAAQPGFPIVGTVPAIKPAAAESRTGVIGVLATERTVEDAYLDDLIARYASDVEVIKQPAQELVSFVETKYLVATEEERVEAVLPYVKVFLEHNVDEIILACTHFLHLEKEIGIAVERLGGKDVNIVDSRCGVVKRVQSIMTGLGVIGNEAATGGSQRAEPGEFLLTSDPPFDPRYALWAERFGLNPPERL